MKQRLRRLEDQVSREETTLRQDKAQLARDRAVYTTRTNVHAGRPFKRTPKFEQIDQYAEENERVRCYLNKSRTPGWPKKHALVEITAESSIFLRVLVDLFIIWGSLERPPSERLCAL